MSAGRISNVPARHDTSGSRIPAELSPSNTRRRAGDTLSMKLRMKSTELPGLQIAARQQCSPHDRKCVVRVLREGWVRSSRAPDPRYPNDHRLLLRRLQSQLVRQRGCATAAGTKKRR
jgi:hypothetical protein